MSETFDPDAWPYPPSGGPTPPPRPANGSHGTAPSSAAPETDYNYEPAAPPYADSEPTVVDEPSNPSNPYGFDDHFDDFGATNDTFDPYANPTYPSYDDTSVQGQHAAPASPPSGHDYYTDDDDIDSTTGGYDDDYDSYDDEFDQGQSRNGGQGSGVGRKILIGLVILCLIIGVVLGIASIFGGSDNKAKSPTTSDTTIVVAQAPADVTDALNRAFAAWGQFAVDGKLDGVRPYFVNDGPEFDKFQTEAAGIQAKAVGGDPLTMAIENPTAIKANENSWILKGLVDVSRTGEPVQQFPWEIHLTRATQNDPWQVLTVRKY